MTSTRKKKRILYQRRFSRNDGVRLPDGREGHIVSTYGNSTEGYSVIVSIKGSTEFTDLVSIKETDLISVPSLNKGKYGGPSRGGSAGGWMGGNNYRKRRK